VPLGSHSVSSNDTSEDDDSQDKPESSINNIADKCKILSQLSIKSAIIEVTMLSYVYYSCIMLYCVIVAPVKLCTLFNNVFVTRRSKEWQAEPTQVIQSQSLIKKNIKAFTR